MIKIESNWDESPMTHDDEFAQHATLNKAAGQALLEGYLHEFEHGDLYLWLLRPLEEYPKYRSWAKAFDPVVAEYFTVNLHSLRSMVND